MSRKEKRPKPLLLSPNPSANASVDWISATEGAVIILVLFIATVLISLIHSSSKVAPGKCFRSVYRHYAIVENIDTVSSEVETTTVNYTITNGHRESLEIERFVSEYPDPVSCDTFQMSELRHSVEELRLRIEKLETR